MDEVPAERQSILSTRSVEILLDLVEIRLGAMEIEDRDDRTIGSLRRCRAELKRIEVDLRATAKRGPGRPRRLYEAA
jgi:hypothetical protein